MIWVPSLNTHVTTGDFLLAAEHEYAVDISVCRVIDVLFPDQLRVTWWLSNEHLYAHEELQNMPPLSSLYNNLIKCQIKEVTERMLAIGTIRTSQVKDICFVFHAVTIEYDIVNCAGMTRVFFYPLSL
jgi:hypothetical protein